jgi:hypothetical protein
MPDGRHGCFEIAEQGPASCFLARPPLTSNPIGGNITACLWKNVVRIASKPMISLKCACVVIVYSVQCISLCIPRSDIGVLCLASGHSFSAFPLLAYDRMQGNVCSGT